MLRSHDKLAKKRPFISEQPETQKSADMLAEESVALLPARLCPEQLRCLTYLYGYISSVHYHCSVCLRLASAWAR